MSVGIHISGQTIRTCRLDTNEAVVSSARHSLPRPLSPDDWTHPDKRLTAVLSDYIEETDEASLALPGGLYHLRRVPMEVAMDVDRRRQVEWEVSQTLASAIGDHRVDYTVRGSYAIWVAVSAHLIERLTESFERRGIRLSVCATPIAIVETLRRQSPKQPATLIVADAGWVTRLGIQNGDLVSAQERAPSVNESPLEDISNWLQPNTAEATYLAADPANLPVDADFVQALYPPVDTDDHPELDTLTSIAYGAALHWQNEAVL